MNPSQLNRQMQELVQLFQSGRLAQACEAGYRILAMAPRQPQVLSLLGGLHGQLGEFSEAEKCYRTLVSIEPLMHMHHCYLGLSLVMQQRLQEAVPVFTRMLQLRPDFAEGHMQMGCLMRDLGLHDQAVVHFQRALELSPRLADAAVFLGNLRVFQGDLDGALACYDQALKHRPGFVDAVAGKAMVLERQGNKKAAWDELQIAVSHGHITPNVAIMYAMLAPKFEAVDKAKKMLDGLLSKGEWMPSQQQELHFALGKLCDRSADFDLAFKHYSEANRISPIRFDMTAYRDKVERIKQVFSSPGLVKARQKLDDEPTPIFIVGMPRSGTSLVEQILSSHPDVSVAGELEVLPEVERQAGELIGSAKPYPECLLEASSDDMTKLVERYRKAVASIGAGARFVTDKLPPNYERLGLIRLLFPEALVIHVKRDPRDTCLSCFFQNFGNTHSYSANLNALCEVYGIYSDLMRYWSATLDMPVLDVTYEAIVAEPEPSIRRILEHCGLDWHDGCLDFHESNRYVNTASYDQVRQPLYRSSVQRWHNYARHLQDLDQCLNEKGL